MDSIWYYVDRAQQRHGPVTADAVAAAYRGGDADDASLVWRDGLAEWVPLATLRAELGLPAATAPVADPPGAALPPAPTYTMPAALPAAPKSRSGCLIAAIVVGILLLVVFGILAAIAVPAYHDYVERAKAAAAEVDAGTAPDGAAEPGLGDLGIFGASAEAAALATALAEARGHQARVDDFVVNTDRCPRDAGEVAVPPVASPGVVAITVGESDSRMCTIEVELGGPGLESLAGQRLTLSRDGGGDWYCTSSITDTAMLPEDCR